MIAKAQTLDADHVLLDLEDSVAPDHKAAARAQVVAGLRAGDWGKRTMAVRINDVTTPWTFRDVLEIVTVAGQHLDCLVVPKITGPADLAFVDRLLNQVEQEAGLDPGHVGLEIQIEDAAGLLSLGDTLPVSPRVEAVILGPGDMAAALGMPSMTIGGPQSDYPGDHWHAVRTSLLLHARRAGVQVIDGPYADVHDRDGFRQLAKASHALGFDGTWVVHPGQIAVANEVYGVDQETYERAADILDAYHAAIETDGRGAVMFGQTMIDEATQKMAAVTAAKGAAQGLAPRSAPPDVPYHQRAAWRGEHLAPLGGDS